MEKKVLVHICCAPCSIHVLRELRREGMDVLGYFYNPNIHPYTEFRRRLETLENYSRMVLLSLIVNRTYDLETFLEGTLGHGRDRCLFCYRTRLEKAFQQGVEEGVDAVTTTLLYSRYQRHDDIKAIATELSDKYATDFLYRDFRSGWKAGIEESQRLNMYRQGYCGCIFSEKERFAST